MEFAGVGSATKRATPSSSKIGIIHNFFCVSFQPFPGLAFLNIQGYIHGGRDKVSSNIPPLLLPPSLPTLLLLLLILLPGPKKIGTVNKIIKNHNNEFWIYSCLVCVILCKGSHQKKAPFLRTLSKSGLDPSPPPLSWTSAR